MSEQIRSVVYGMTGGAVFALAAAAVSLLVREVRRRRKRRMRSMSCRQRVEWEDD